MNDAEPSDGEIREQLSEDLKIAEEYNNEIRQLRSDYESRLVEAHLRTEAVRAGMIDLDGLKLLDKSAIRLDPNGGLVGSRELMDSFRRNKPWLFGSASSSSATVAPSSKPLQQKTALEMTEEEYLAARASLTKRRH
jgi:hypothetical protein